MKIEISVESNIKNLHEINEFNPVGKSNWITEFFNENFSKSFLTVARNEDSKIVGTQGFIEYEMNIYGNKRTAFRTERTLLSTECRGKGVFKKQVDLGKNLCLKRGGKFCFGTTNAKKAFASAGWQVHSSYRIYGVICFSRVKTFYYLLSTLYQYVRHDFKRIMKKEFTVYDLYNFLFLKSLFSKIKFKRKVTNYYQRSKHEAKLRKFRVIDTVFTSYLSEEFNKRDNGVFLWYTENFFLRLNNSTPVLYYLHITSENQGVHIILQKIKNGFYKIIDCTNYDLWHQYSASNSDNLRKIGIYSVLEVRNKYRIPSDYPRNRSELNFTSLEGFGTLLFINLDTLTVSDLEVEESWLLL